jgi:hypothetical protein
MARARGLAGGLPAAAPAPSAPTDNHASAASFASAKDQQGLIARSAIDSLTEQMGAHNLSGSSIEGRELSNVVSGSSRNLSDTVRDQTIEDARRTQEVEDRNLNYGLATRAQDISAYNAQQDRIHAIVALMRATGRSTIY